MFDHVSRSGRSRSVLQRSCGGSCSSGPGACSDCNKKNVQRSAAGPAPGVVPNVVHEVLDTPGNALEDKTRAALEPRFGIVLGSTRTSVSHVGVATSPLVVGEATTPFEREADAMAERIAGASPEVENGPRLDLRHVRIHTDARAAASARAVQARAFTVGHHIVFDSGAYAPHTAAGQRLLAHELTHVMQQGSGEVRRLLQRQGAGAAAATPQPVDPDAPLPRVCSRPTDSIGLGAQHGYLKAGTFTFGLMNHCRNTGNSLDLGVPGQPTAAKASDQSPDPCTTPQSEKRCVECIPKAGVTDVASCMHSAFAGYPKPAEYVVSGPNSNTFTKVIASACCEGMTDTPSHLRWMPGWSSDTPAATTAECPQSEGQCGKEPMPPAGERAGNAVVGGLGYGLQLGAAGGVLGGIAGGLIGLAAGAPGLGMLIGAVALGGLGFLAGAGIGAYAGSRRPRRPNT